MINNKYKKTNYNVNSDSDSDCCQCAGECSCDDYDSCDENEIIKVTVLFHNMETICSNSMSKGKYAITWIIAYTHNSKEYNNNDENNNKYKNNDEDNNDEDNNDEDNNKEYNNKEYNNNDKDSNNKYKNNAKNVYYIKGPKLLYESAADIIITAKASVKCETGINYCEVQLSREQNGHTTKINNEHPFDGFECPCNTHGKVPLDIHAVELRDRTHFKNTNISFIGTGSMLSRSPIKLYNPVFYTLDTIAEKDLTIIYTSVEDFNTNIQYKGKFLITWILSGMISGSPHRGLYHNGYNKIAFHTIDHMEKFVKHLVCDTTKIKFKKINLIKEQPGTITYVNGNRPFSKNKCGWN